MATEQDDAIESTNATPSQAETAASGHDEVQDASALKTELDRIKKALTETNRKAAADRKFREDVEKDAQRKKDAELPELDRLKEEKARLEREKAELTAEKSRAEARALAIETDRQIERHAIAEAFESPELVPKLIERDRLIYEEDGSLRLSSVKDAVQRLAKDYPGLLKAKSGGGSPAAIRARQGAGGDAGQSRPSRHNIDPYEQELIEMGRGGRM